MHIQHFSQHLLFRKRFVDISQCLCVTFICTVEIHWSNASSEGNIDIDGVIDSVDVGAEAVLTNEPVSTYVS